MWFPEMLEERDSLVSSHGNIRYATLISESDWSWFGIRGSNRVFFMCSVSMT